jgi:hypothetical protein
MARRILIFKLSGIFRVTVFISNMHCITHRFMVNRSWDLDARSRSQEIETLLGLSSASATQSHIKTGRRTRAQRSCHRGKYSGQGVGRGDRRSSEVISVICFFEQEKSICSRRSEVHRPTKCLIPFPCIEVSRLSASWLSRFVD